MQGTQRPKQPVQIKPRQLCTSPPKPTIENQDIRIDLKNLTMPEHKHVNLFDHQNIFTARSPLKENKNMSEIQPNIAGFHQVIRTRRSPPHVEIEKIANRPIVHAEPLATVPMRELQQLQHRCQHAQVQIHELTMCKNTLQMEKKQFSEAYQELKTSSQKEKRTLNKALEEIKVTYDAQVRENTNLKLQNQMLSTRLTERSSKLQTLLQSFRDRSNTNDKKDDSTIWKSKYQNLKKKVAELTFPKYNYRGEAISDPDEKLNNISRWIDDLISLHNSQKQNYKDEISRLKKVVDDLLNDQQSHSLSNSMKVSIARHCEPAKSTIVYTTVRSVTKTVPWEEQRELLLQWRVNIENFYKKQIQELKKQYEPRELLPFSKYSDHSRNGSPDVILSDIQDSMVTSQIRHLDFSVDLSKN